MNIQGESENGRAKWLICGKQIISDYTDSGGNTCIKIENGLLVYQDYWNNESFIFCAKRMYILDDGNILRIRMHERVNALRINAVGEEIREILAMYGYRFTTPVRRTRREAIMIEID